MCMHEINLYDSIFLFWNTKSWKTICDDVRLHVFMSDNLLKLIKEY
jgi:hypothetical protein